MTFAREGKAFTLRLVVPESGDRYAVLTFTNPREFRGGMGDAGREMRIQMSLDQLQELADITHIAETWRDLG